MKNLFFLIFGVLIGSWISWPGIFLPENWKCFNEIVENSKNEKISIKAILAVSPKYILRGIPEDNVSKFRIVSDACFR
ncbi:MAG: hypothetical protein CMK49_03345 [Prochlorococcus sp. SP3034]|nr:hypothetical protein [Prochlorococcus sp. SP3034]|tara:strand:+ start:13190 stop:13423 length:234 start_codon:yes stop_codon:yes gene_type:complete